jgi:hypothetical protein
MIKITSNAMLSNEMLNFAGLPAQTAAAHHKADNRQRVHMSARSSYRDALQTQ